MPPASRWLPAACIVLASVGACSKKSDGRGTSGGTSATSVASTTSTSAMTGTGGAGGGDGGTGGAGGFAEGGSGGDGGSSAGGAGGEGGFVSGALPKEADCDESASVDAATEGAFDVGQQRAYVFGSFLGPGSNIVSRLTFPVLTQFPLPVTGLVSAPELRTMVLSPLGDTIAVAATPLATGKPAVLAYSSDLMVGPQVLAESASPAQPIHQLGFSPDGRWLAMLAELELDDAIALYVLAVDGSTPTPIRLSHPPVDPSRDVLRFAWATTSDASHARLAFTADVESDDVVGAYVVDAVVGGEPTPLVPTAGLAAGAGVAATGFGWDHTDRVYFRSRHAGTDTPRLYRAHADGSALEEVLVTQLTNELGVAQVPSFALSPDGTRLAFAANAPSRRLYEVYVAPVDGSAALRVSKLQAEPPPAGTRGASTSAELVWSPNGKRLGVVADWETTPGTKDDAFTAFVLPTEVGGGLRAIAAPGEALLDVQRISFSRDSRRLYALGDLLQDERFELYSAPAGGKGDVPPLAALAQSSATSTGRVLGVIDAP
jgi:hypothetical protein